MEFHVSREARNRTGVEDALFNYAGNVVFGNLSACRKFVAKYNETQASRGESGVVLHAGAVYAMGLIDELNHAMIASYRETLDPEVLPQALNWLEANANRAPVDKLLLEFTTEFPNVSVYRGKQTAQQWLSSVTDAAEAGTSKDIRNREIAIEELLMLWLANRNPAFSPFKELFDDRRLAEKTIYADATATLPEFFLTRPLLPEQGSLLDALLAPILASPDSLSGQLAYMRDNWADHLGASFSEALRRTILAVDVLREEDIAIWTRFNPGPRGGLKRYEDGSHFQEGFVGDEFVGFGDGAVIGSDGARRLGLEQPPPLNEYEAFSPDQAWMPTVVMIAKSTYVWLEQLSKKYQRHIQRLDQIPGEEFELLASRGINALWLIGLWERSTASQTIKRLMGQSDAVASAYSLKDYRIAEDLGGTWAYEQLRDTAGRYGIRLASDMVPNHMGIDSTWVMEHPEWFLSRHESPFPVYSFDGPDLSTESRYEIKIDDHYFDQTDAAVVFRLRERSNGDTRFVYHGNDGTTFAWNDTAQLDYSKAFVREHVIQTILEVARLFPIIRFDAAMTLAKKHVQRLWFPLPGIGGSIPSRAESAISQAEFDAMMPNEFWREVVDRVAVEVPGTLLLAEAFWLLEGYFVRTLGMHRVYNSAFMNMLRDEENAKYRSYLKKTIEFDPDILKRYVNFMSNPDEKTAIAQFGTGDKYFGTCTMLATIPGLPMIGHGQIEAFTEKYGMEYKTARFDEYPNEDLIARHQREIAPLLKNRQLFAESNNFVMYDFWTGEGEVNENVFVYSNRVDHGGNGYGGSGKERALIFYNNAYQSTQGTIHISVADMDKYRGQLRQRTLANALHLPTDSRLYLAWRDSASNLEYLRCSTNLEHSGLTIELRGYQYAVLLDWRELYATNEQPWDRLAGALRGHGVSSLDEALSKLRLRPIREALRDALSPGVLQAFCNVAVIPNEVKAADASLEAAPEVSPVSPSTKMEKAGAAPAKGSESVAERFADLATSVEASSPQLQIFLRGAERFYDECQRVSLSGTEQSGEVFKTKLIVNVKACAGLPATEAHFSMPWPDSARKALPSSLDFFAKPGTGQSWAPTLAWMLLRELAPSSDPALFDSLDLRDALADIFQGIGAERETSWRLAARVRILLAHPSVGSVESLVDAKLWADPDIRWLACLSEAEGITYVNKECLEELIWWLQVPRLFEIASTKAGTAKAVQEIESFIAAVSAAAIEAGYDLANLLAVLGSSSKPTMPKPTVPALPISKSADKQKVEEIASSTDAKDEDRPQDKPLVDPLQTIN